MFVSSCKQARQEDMTDNNPTQTSKCIMKQGDNHLRASLCNLRTHGHVPAVLLPANAVAEVVASRPLCHRAHRCLEPRNARAVRCHHPPPCAARGGTACRRRHVARVALVRVDWSSDDNLRWPNGSRPALVQHALLRRRQRSVVGKALIDDAHVGTRVGRVPSRTHRHGARHGHGSEVLRVSAVSGTAHRAG